jgi:hypothetical protein
MIAKLAYLTTPGPDRFVINFQVFGCEGIQSIEISKDHMANIVIDGAALVIRSATHTPTEREHERSTAGA